MITSPQPTMRPFNSPLEAGLRMLFVLNASKGEAADLQRLVCYDYLLVHSGDVSGGPESLHPSVPFRGTELLVKRDIVGAGLNWMFSRELIEKTFDVSGILYKSTRLTTAFISLLTTHYSVALKSRADWVVARFGPLNDFELADFMSQNVGRWGAEFDHLSALSELEL